MVWGALIGAGASIAGSALSSRGQGGGGASGRGFATGNLWGAENPMGHIKYDSKNSSMQFAMDPTRKALWNLNKNVINRGGINPYQERAAAFAANRGYRDLERNYRTAQSGTYNRATQQLFDARMGNAMTRSGQLGQLAQQRASEMFGAGRGLIDGANYDDIRDERLGILRQQAQPYEERAQNSLMQKLFSIGHGPAGAVGLPYP